MGQLTLRTWRTGRLARVLAAASLMGLTGLASAGAAAAATTASTTASTTAITTAITTAAGFDAVQPLLARQCTLCHQGANAPLGLRLDSLAGVLAGSSRGPVVKAGDAAGSELVKRLDGRSQPRMPLTGPPYLGDADIALVRAWIDAGLQPGAASSPPATLGSGRLDLPVAPPAIGLARGSPPTWRDVAPLFATRCTRCHAAQGLLGPAPEGYRLTSHDAATSAQDRVRIVPGRPQASELLRRIKGQALPRMPLDGPPWLSDDEIALVDAWISAGARDSLGQPAPMPVGARIRLRGVLAADGTLDGLALPAAETGRQGGRDGRGGRGGGGGGGGRRDRDAPPGAAVELRGCIQPDGSVAVDRLRGR